MSKTQAILTARTEFASALNQVCSERGIESVVVIETIKAAILAAFRKDAIDKFDEDYQYSVDLDAITGGAKIYRFKEDKTKNKQDVTPPGFGRIAAQTAKQVILQKIREAEKEAIIQDYQDKVGNLVSGMILRWDGKNIIADIGRGQGLLPPQEQVRSERYSLNRRMTFYISDIRDTMRGKQVIISRVDSKLVKGLFKREVPEVNSGVVEINSIAREPGVRTKIAVISTQPGVDPVGSCVGQKGVRVQAVIEELNGEKIDIIQFSQDKQKFIGSALAPAENLVIKIDDKKKLATVTVPEDQLSLAIGRDGQNVRLAAKLTGYKIDIKEPKGKAIKVDNEDSLEALKLKTSSLKALKAAGLGELAKISKVEEKDLANIKGLTEKDVAKIIKKIEQLEAKKQALSLKQEKALAKVRAKQNQAAEKDKTKTDKKAVKAKKTKKDKASLEEK